MKFIEYKITGIKCDNKKCDYRDTSVKYEDYPEWLNRLCPKCGEVLLTHSDLNAVGFIFALFVFINFVFKPFMFLFRKVSRKKMSIRFDGTGVTRVVEED